MNRLPILFDSDMIASKRSFIDLSDLNSSMTLQEFEKHLARISYGKRLPNALYLFRDGGSDFGPELNQLLAQATAVFSVGLEFNVIKFRTDDLKVSFLCYPGFMDDSHLS